MAWRFNATASSNLLRGAAVTPERARRGVRRAICFLFIATCACARAASFTSETQRSATRALDTRTLARTLRCSTPLSCTRSADLLTTQIGDAGPAALASCRCVSQLLRRRTAALLRSLNICGTKLDFARVLRCILLIKKQEPAVHRWLCNQRSTTTSDGHFFELLAFACLLHTAPQLCIPLLLALRAVAASRIAA